MSNFTLPERIKTLVDRAASATGKTVAVLASESEMLSSDFRKKAKNKHLSVHVDGEIMRFECNDTLHLALHDAEQYLYTLIEMETLK